jgi:pilus assembly protein CpaE
MAEDEKIRVVIVDDIAETRENVRKLLQFENDFEVVGAARTGREGIQLAHEVNPDVILMDINMPDMDGISATEAILRELPHIQIVILSVQGDPNYMRRAMLAGARDFLTKPPPVDELTSAIRRAGLIAHDERDRLRKEFIVKPGTGPIRVDAAMNELGKVIVVYSPKGGVGCTTLATNLSIMLQSDDSPVVLVDGNLQFGDIAVFLNQQGKNSIVDLAPRVDELDTEIIDEVLIQHKESGVKVLVSPSRPEYAENVTADQFNKILQYLKLMFSYVVVDTSSNLSDLTLSAIDAADLIVLMTTQEIPAIKSARLFLDLVDVIKISREQIMFVMNRYDKKISITPEKISENIRQEITSVLPYDDRAIFQSVNHGMPFILGDKTRPTARSFLALADQVRERLTQLEPEEAVSIASSNGRKSLV